MKKKLGKITLEIVKGDITEETTDAIVNAANSSLSGGGGVDGAIQHKAGSTVMQECQMIIRQRGSCLAGTAVSTSGGRLSCKYIIHAVGPIWHGGSQDEEGLLYDAYKSSLRIASLKQLQSISFPNISTGVYNFPKEEAANIVLEAIQDFAEKESSLELIRFVCFDEENYKLYLKVFAKLDD